MNNSELSRKQPKAPRSSMIKGVLENVNKELEKKKRKSNPQVPEPESKPQRTDVVLSVDSEGKTLAAVNGQPPKTREQLNREADKIFKKVDKITGDKRGGRTKKRRTRKRKTRKRKRRRTKKKRKSRRRKRRRTRK